MKFRKRKKILPGVYVNFSKSGISTTIGGKGLSVNVGKRGSYLNTSIPGTGLYNRIKVNTGGRPTHSSKKNKYSACIIAFLFGGIGLHRFYLEQYGFGFLYLLFCWTLIPLLLSWLDGFLFLLVSESHFERKYNHT